MDYVLTENGNIKITDGQPTVKGTDGKEFGIDAIGAQAKIGAITTESNQRRKDLSTANASLEAFKGIEDPVAALDALQKITSMDKDQATALENLKNTINKTWAEKQIEWDTEKATLTENLFKANVGSQFATSEVIKSTVLTPDIAAKFFGSHFNPDGTANDSAGNLIYSKAKPGEAAGFDEAMQQIIDAYPGKDAILRGSGADGGDGHRRQDGGKNLAPMSRDAFNSMSPALRSKFIKDGGKVE